MLACSVPLPMAWLTMLAEADVAEVLPAAGATVAWRDVVTVMSVVMGDAEAAIRTGLAGATQELSSRAVLASLGGPVPSVAAIWALDVALDV